MSGGKTFREAVNAIRDADAGAFNKYNSIRVDAFYEKLDRVPKATSNVSLAAVRELLTAVTALSKPDAEYILTGSPAMQKKIAEHLTAGAKTAVESSIRGKATASGIR